MWWDCLMAKILSTTQLCHALSQMLHHISCNTSSGQSLISLPCLHVSYLDRLNPTENANKGRECPVFLISLSTWNLMYTLNSWTHLAKTSLNSQTEQDHHQDRPPPRMVAWPLAVLGGSGGSFVRYVWPRILKCQTSRMAMIWYGICVVKTHSGQQSLYFRFRHQVGWSGTQPPVLIANRIMTTWPNPAANQWLPIHAHWLHAGGLAKERGSRDSKQGCQTGTWGWMLYQSHMHATSCCLLTRCGHTLWFRSTHPLLVVCSLQWKSYEKDREKKEAIAKPKPRGRPNKHRKTSHDQSQLSRNGSCKCHSSCGARCSVLHGMTQLKWTNLRTEQAAGLNWDITLFEHSTCSQENVTKFASIWACHTKDASDIVESF